MITAYSCQSGTLQAQEIAAGQTIPPDTVWLDLFEPVREEEQLVEQAFGFDVPTREEMQEIEISSRLYHDGGATITTATIIAQADSEMPISRPITFVLIEHRLVTIRYSNPQPFRQFVHHTQRPGTPCGSGEDILAGLLDAVVDRLADILERVQHNMDALSAQIFAKDRKRGDINLENIVRQIGLAQSLNMRVRESLVSVSRLLLFLSRPGDSRPDKAVGRTLKTLSRDVTSLSDHANYLSTNITFLLDATLGMINIEQTGIIKIFSVAAVVFLPPTLIASIYGMNFHHMPELDFIWGYPMSIALMVLFAILPYWFFKHRRWL